MCVTVRCCCFLMVRLSRTVVFCGRNDNNRRIGMVLSNGCDSGIRGLGLMCLRSGIAVVFNSGCVAVRVVTGISNRILSKTYGQTHGTRENQRVGQEFDIAGKNKHTSCFILLIYRAAVAVVSAAGAAAPAPFCSARNWNTYLIIFQRSS